MRRPTPIFGCLEIGPCADILAQEARWLKAITDGDVATVEQVLGPNFKHVNADGRFFDRAAEIASMEKLPFTMNPSEQMVDIAGDTAVIHGVNTSIQDGEVVARERFTDVFVLQNGNWMALSDAANPASTSPISLCNSSRMLRSLSCANGSS